ncbi:MAG: MTH938/NDUFAF3 family protein [Pseudomonadota bacterium]
MQLQESKNRETINIQSVQNRDGGIVLTIDQEVFTEAVIIDRHSVDIWNPDNSDALSDADFSWCADKDYEVVLLGTGNRLRFPDPSIRVLLAQLGTGLEVMDTSAACRTFNLLVSDDRRVAAALLP